MNAVSTTRNGPEGGGIVYLSISKQRNEVSTSVLELNINYTGIPYIPDTRTVNLYVLNKHTSMIFSL